MRPAWRLLAGAPDTLIPDASCGAGNMAVDHALFERVQVGAAPVLRFYRWQPACLSLGRNQASAKIQDSAVPGIDIVRRPTGGLAVLHDHELTYSVAAPVSAFGSPRAAYQAINAALLRGLLRLGVQAEPVLADSTAQTFRSAGSCFASAAPGEVSVAGRKLVGSAQRYEQRTILQHGSILIEGGQSAADRLLGREHNGPEAASLREVLARTPDWSELVCVFRSSFEQELGIALAPATLDPEERERASELTQHYASPEWTWRA